MVELDLVDPKPHCLVSRSEAVAVAEIKQDGGGLADQDISVLQERRRKRRMGDVASLQKSHERRLAAAFTFRLATLGAVDFSGGYVIHLSACTSGFVAAAVIGPRLQADRDSSPPNNLLLALAGAGILWLGWNGFNGGDPYLANANAGAAVLNTNVSTATALLVWTMMDTQFNGKPSIVGAINGMIAGLVGITPAAGYVDGWGASSSASVRASFPG